MLAATEAALRGGASSRLPLATADMPRGAATGVDAAAASGRSTADAVVGRDGRVAALDLHGLSGAEARAAVLSTLYQLQVMAGQTFSHASEFHQLTSENTVQT